MIEIKGWVWRKSVTEINQIKSSSNLTWLMRQKNMFILQLRLSQNLFLNGNYILVSNYEWYPIFTFLWLDALSPHTHTYCRCWLEVVWKHATPNKLCVLPVYIYTYTNCCALTNHQLNILMSMNNLLFLCQCMLISGVYILFYFICFAVSKSNPIFISHAGSVYWNMSLSMQNNTWKHICSFHRQNQAVFFLQVCEWPLKN